MKRITTGGRKGEIQKLVHVERVNGQWRSTLEKIKEKGEWWGSLITRGAPGVFVDKGGGGGETYMQMVVPRPCDGKEKKVSLSLFALRFPRMHE